MIVLVYYQYKQQRYLLTVFIDQLLQYPSDMEFDGVWWSLVEFGGVWWSLVGFGGVWWSLVEFDGV